MAARIDGTRYSVTAAAPDALALAATLFIPGCFEIKVHVFALDAAGAEPGDAVLAHTLNYVMRSVASAAVTLTGAGGCTLAMGSNGRRVLRLSPTSPCARVSLLGPQLAPVEVRVVLVWDSDEAPPPARTLALTATGGLETIVELRSKAPAVLLPLVVLEPWRARAPTSAEWTPGLQRMDLIIPRYNYTERIELQFG